MNEDIYKKALEVLRAYMTENLSEQTREYILSWYLKKGNQKEKDAALKVLWDEAVTGGKPDMSLIGELNAIREKLNLPPSDITPDTFRRTPLRRKLMMVAAVVIPMLLLGSGIWLFSLDTPAAEPTFITVAAGSDIREVALPDGSEVWLHPDSRIVYRSDFNEERNLELAGKAYFDIKRNPGKPLKVVAGKASVTVLGTEFLIKAYDNAATEVTLHSGSVAVEAGGRELKLSPEEQFELSPDGNSMSVTKVRLEDGKRLGLSFRKSTLAEIFETIEASYGIDIDINGTLPPTRYTIDLNNRDNLHTILAVLANLSGEFTYDTRGDNITIKTNK